MNLPELPPLTSEEVEPAMMKMLCHLYSACEKTKGDQIMLHAACNRLWIGVNSMSMLSVCVRGNFGLNDNSLLHFSIASSGEIRKAARYIEEVMGFDPDREWKIKWP